MGFSIDLHFDQYLKRIQSRLAFYVRTHVPSTTTRFVMINDLKIYMFMQYSILGPFIVTITSITLKSITVKPPFLIRSSLFPRIQQVSYS